LVSKTVEPTRPNLRRDDGIIAGCARDAGQMTIAFVNNMGPSGFETADRQFHRLVDLAVGGAACRFSPFTLTDAPRFDPGRGNFLESYAPIGEIWDRRIHALIITGAEPNCDDLREEAYWARLTDLLDWAEADRIPVLLSCLAAHAAVLHWDGIPRRRLPMKRFGVFRQQVVSEHRLVHGLASSMALPHSRWNEIDLNSLAACGYTVITRTQDGAVDSFIRQGRNLVMGFQGHPEYDAETLLLEYRRDVRRYLTGIAPQYPEFPIDYFSPDEVRQLNTFRDRALSKPNADLMSKFPIQVSPRLHAAPWQQHARILCGNWLGYVRELVG
jgi:homoserine O-succinyltransferase/O-acetyltransferase